jgi:DNA-binding beta-propeller fold protein YncE
MKQAIINRSLGKLIILAISILFTPSVMAESKGVAYVSNQDGGVKVIDLETMEFKGSLEIGAKGPRGIGITSNGKWLVTANKDDSNISVVDTSGTNPPKFVVVGKNPEFVRIKDNLAFITYEPSSKSGPPKTGPNAAKDDDDEDKVPGHIAIVDLKNGKVLMDIVGKPETEGLEFTKDGKQLVVANESDNSLTVHDLKTGKLLKNIPVSQYGNRPRGIKTSPDGKTYAATLELSNKLLILNDKFEVIKEIPTGMFPYGLSFDRTGDRIFVAANKAKLLQVFDAKTYEKIKDIPTGDRCWHFSFTPDDQQLLLACGKSNEIIVVDTNKLEVTKHIEDKDTPWGIVTYPKSMGSIDNP